MNKTSHAARTMVLGAATLAASCALSGIATAQSSGDYVPPKLVKRGALESPVAGNGTVFVQVFVKPDGTFKVSKVISSTNPRDNSAALQIANASTYQPATRAGKRIPAFYDYKITFTGGASVSSDAADTGGSGPAETFMRMARAGNFAGAKSGVTAYLKNNPTDPRGNLVLAIADSYTSDPVGGAAAFDKAGTIPENFRTLAQQTYLEAANAAYKEQRYPEAVALSKKSAAIGASVTAYNILGNSEFQLKDYAAAVADLEKARAAFDSAKASTQQRAVIDGNLAAAYFANDQSDRGLAIAKEAMQLDPSQPGFQTTVVNYYIGKANTLRQGGKAADAGAVLEQAAAVAPKSAVALYTQAANDYSSGSAPDLKRAKASIGKALAIAPDDARANFVAGVVSVNDHDSKTGLVYLNKADAAAKAASDTALTAQIEAAIKRVPK